MTSPPQDKSPQVGVSERELDVGSSLLRAYIDSAHDGIFVVSDTLHFHLVNPLLSSWIGRTENELTDPARPASLIEALGLSAVTAHFMPYVQAAAHGEASCFELDMAPPHGVARWVEVSLSRVRTPTGDRIIGILRDITERRIHQSRLQHHASHDDLTGLMNRREFQQRLLALVKSAQADHGQHALVYIDLDQFKVVNDTCGHAAGDELLRQLGHLFLRQVRARDVIARLGGDEFGLLLHNLPIETAMQVARDLCERLARYRFVWKDHRFEITASVGVRAINGETLSAEDALSAADSACYVAKDQGRNRVQLYFGGEVCTGKRQEMAWVSRLQKALDENRFEIWHQRIRDLGPHAGGRTDHFEVLLRLIDETGAIIAPGQYFPAAERYGLMPAIDRWVIQHLLLDDQGADLHAALHHAAATHCAINLSGASLNDDKFLAFLENALARTTLSGPQLCFEITETVAIHNVGRIRDVMQRLRQFGCRFALDDFGSGMSSFSYLKTLPVDFLKIDGSLVSGVAEDATDRAMVEAINRVGGALGLQTIAEFVDTEARLHVLREIGIHFAQGFHIHRPEPLFPRGAAHPAQPCAKKG
ncbi:MAG: putative bifunctional diguanylate cyclase/phosphodiesterase [Gammaproteobacteria bacterium]